MNSKIFIRVISLFVILLAGLVIIGWVFDISLFKSVVPGYSTMKLNSAICLLVAGGLLLGRVDGLNRRAYLLGALFITVLGALSFSQDVFGFNLGMDELFVADQNTIVGAPGRMATTTALSFFLVGVAFILIQAKRFRPYGQYTIHLVTLITFIAILGYFYQVPSLYRLSFLSGMALHTSMALFIFSIAFSLGYPNLGLTGLFTGNGVGNQMARSLFPRMVVFIVVVSFLRVVAHRLGLVTVDFGIALFAISLVSVVS